MKRLAGSNYVEHVAERIILQQALILQTHAIAAARSEPQADGHPGKALISGCMSPKSACLHALMVSSKQPVVGRPGCA